MMGWWYDCGDLSREHPKMNDVLSLYSLEQSQYLLGGDCRQTQDSTSLNYGTLSLNNSLASQNAALGLSDLRFSVVPHMSVIRFAT